MRNVETHPTIKNKKARQITHVAVDYQMKSIFGKMEEKGVIEQVPDTRTSSTISLTEEGPPPKNLGRPKAKQQVGKKR